MVMMAMGSDDHGIDGSVEMVVRMVVMVTMSGGWNGGDCGDAYRQGHQILNF